MLDIDEMGQDEIHELLHKVGYGHLGFIHEGKPCVMPMHYYLENASKIDVYAQKLRQPNRANSSTCFKPAQGK